jgi:multiple sugar transport system permease protein
MSSASQEATIARSRRAPRLTHAWAKSVPYFFLSPAVLVLLVIVVIPVIISLGLGFTRWDGLGEPIFTGLDNYANLVRDELFHKSIFMTLYYTIGSTLVGAALSLGLAVLLNQPLRFRGFFRSIYFLPVTVSMVISGIIWQILLTPDLSVINYALENVGLPRQNLLVNPDTAMIAVILVGLWRNLGYNMVIFLAGLQSIPQVLYEAAAIDGAGRVDSFLSITLPRLKPTTVFVLVTTAIRSFQVFDQVYVLTKGGPAYGTFVLVYYIYREAFQRFHLGYASTIAFVLFIMVLLATLIQLRLLGTEID